MAVENEIVLFRVSDAEYIPARILKIYPEGVVNLELYLKGGVTTLQDRIYKGKEVGTWMETGEFAPKNKKE